MTAPNIFDLADEELDRERADAPTPRTGFNDREPIRKEVGGGYGMLSKVGEAIKRAPSAIAGTLYSAQDEMVGGFTDEWLNGVIPGAGDAVQARVQRDTPAALRGLGSLVGAGAQGVALGAAAPAALVAKVNRGRPILDGALRAAGGGAVGGAVAGAGHSDGGVADRAMAALVGGGVGAAAGGALGLAGGAVRGARNLLAPSEARIASEGDAVFADLLRRSGKSAEEARGELAALRSRGVDARAVDVLGRPGQKVLGVLEGKSTDGAEATAKALGARQRDLGEHLAGRFLEAAKMGETPDAGAMVQDIIERRSAKAAPAYKAALEEGVQVTDEGVRSILSQPRWQQAYQVADELRLVNGEPPLPPVYDGDGNVLPTVDLRALHWTKLGMDDLLSRQGETNVGKQLKRGLGEQVRTVMAAAKEASPKYAAAADEFAGESELLDAIELGKGFLNKSPNQLAREVAALSPAQREAYQAQALDEVVKKLGDVRGTGDPSRIFDTPNWERRIRTLFGDDADQVMQGIRDVEQLSSTFRATQGSRTMPLQAAEEQLAKGIGQSLVQGSLGRPSTGLAKITADKIGLAAQGVTGRVGENVLGRLMADDITLQRALDDLSARRGIGRSAAAGNFVTSTIFGRGGQ